MLELNEEVSCISCFIKKKRKFDTAIGLIAVSSVKLKSLVSHCNLQNKSFSKECHVLNDFIWNYACFFLLKR